MRGHHQHLTAPAAGGGRIQRYRFGVGVGGADWRQHAPCSVLIGLARHYSLARDGRPAPVVMR